MIANLITLSRLILVFVVVSLFNTNFYLNVAMVALIVIIIAMDALDGYMARKYKTASDFGAFFDIVGDRIVENTFWLYFGVIGLIPFWIPIVVVARGFITDSLRNMEYAHSGKTPFAMVKSRWSKFLVSSRYIRGAYAVSKVAAFCALGIVISLNSGVAQLSLPISTSALNLATVIAQVIAYIAVAICIIRGLPVIWEAREYIYSK